MRLLDDTNLMPLRHATSRAANIDATSASNSSAFLAAASALPCLDDRRPIIRSVAWRTAIARCPRRSLRGCATWDLAYQRQVGTSAQQLGSANARPTASNHAQRAVAKSACACPSAARASGGFVRVRHALSRASCLSAFARNSPTGSSANANADRSTGPVPCFFLAFMERLLKCRDDRQILRSASSNLAAKHVGQGRYP